MPQVATPPDCQSDAQARFQVQSNVLHADAIVGADLQPWGQARSLLVLSQCDQLAPGGTGAGCWTPGGPPPALPAAAGTGCGRSSGRGPGLLVTAIGTGGTSNGACWTGRKPALLGAVAAATGGSGFTIAAVKVAGKATDNACASAAATGAGAGAGCGAPEAADGGRSV